MPNQRDPKKLLFGGYIDHDLADLADDIAREEGLRSRAELIERLIRGAASARGIKVKDEPSRYGIDRARSQRKRPTRRKGKGKS